MIYTCPEECAGVTHGSTWLARRPDGTIEADAEAAPALAPHGIVPMDVSAPPPRRRADDRRMLR